MSIACPHTKRESNIDLNALGFFGDRERTGECSLQGDVGIYWVGVPCRQAIIAPAWRPTIQPVGLDFYVIDEGVDDLVCLLLDYRIVQ